VKNQVAAATDTQNGYDQSNAWLLIALAKPHGTAWTRQKSTDDLSRDSLHLFGLRAQLQQQQIHACALEL
jgi:hypothetical protein